MTTQSTWAVRDARERTDTPRYLELLDAAARVITSRGYDATTVGAITDAAGVSRATLYIYFSSKEEVFAALAARVRDDFLAAQEPAIESDDPIGILSTTIRAFADAIHADGPLLRIIEDRGAFDPAIAELAREITERPLSRFVRYLDREAGAGRIAPVTSTRVVAETVADAISRGVLARRDAPAHERTAYVSAVTTIALTLVGLRPDHSSDPGKDPR